MSSSRLHRPDNPLNVREKKNERNRKKREKFAALSKEKRLIEGKVEMRITEKI